MSLQRKHKTFRFFQLMPIDANNVLFEQALLRLLVLLHTNGRLITKTDPVKPEFPEQIIDIIKDDLEHFEGITGTQRERMVKNWFAADFATIVKEGKERSGKGRIANLKPLHMSTIKLLNTKIRSQDRDASLFLYNVFKGSEIIRHDGFLIPFLTEGTVLHGTYNLILNEDDISILDIETLFLLRILEKFKVDNPDTQSKIPNFEFICSAQKELFLTDILTLLAYKDSIPRRELFQYFSILTMFHTALYAIKTFSLVNGFFDKKSARCSLCKKIANSKDFNSLIKCEYHPKIFVDMTNGQDRTCDKIASNNVNEHYAEMYRYFKSHYKLKKLSDYSKTTTTSDLSLEDLLGFLDNPVTDAYFALQLKEILDYEENKDDPDIQTIINSGMTPFEKYIEILCQDKSNWKALVSRHKKLMSSLCGMNREDGFLHGGRGKKRKYMMGNQLLEVLVQLSVVGADDYGFKTQPITITKFVEWLKNRYGILIDTSGEETDSPEIARALESNYESLKDRLRQLGFFTDLSDASNSQTIKPRFPIKSE